MSKNGSVKLSLKVHNKSSKKTLQNVTINLPGIDSIMLHNIEPQGTDDAGKVGPFPMQPMDIKGSIAIGGENATIKVTIPSSLTMTPLQLHQEQVASMLSSGNWESYSLKVDIKEGMDDNSLKMKLLQFLLIIIKMELFKSHYKSGASLFFSCIFILYLVHYILNYLLL